MTQPINRETAIALAKEAGMAGMLTDVVCSFEEIHRLCNLAVAHSRKDAEPVYRVLQSTRDGSLFSDGKPMWDKSPFDDLWLETGIAKEVLLFTHPSEADKLLQQALEAQVAMQMEAKARNCGLKICDDSIDAIRTYLEGKK